MVVANLIVLALLGFLLLLILSLSFTRWFTERAAYKFATSVGIGLTDDLLPAVRARLALQQRGTALGGLLGLGTAALLVLNETELARSTFGSLTFAGIAIAGMSVGNALTAVRPDSRGDADQPRLARAGAVSLADYIAPLEHSGAFAAVALSVSTMFIFIIGSSVMHPAPLLWRSGPLILAALSAASLIVFEVAGRRILRRGQPAGSPTELAWNDALRAQRLRSLISAPLVLGAYGTFASLSATSTAFTLIGGRPFAVGFATANLAFTVIAVVVLIMLWITKPQRFFLRRLWPNAEAVA